MSERKDYRRLSSIQAATLAKSIAEDFLTKKSLQWKWQIAHANAAEPRTTGDRKVFRHWHVVVNWSDVDGAMIDGPSIVSIDLETGVAAFSA